MRATKFDPERTSNASNGRPNGQVHAPESDQPAAVQPPRATPPPPAPPPPAPPPLAAAPPPAPPAPEPRYRSTAPGPPAPAPRPELPVRPDPPRPEPPRPVPQYRSTAPAAPAWYVPQPEPPPVRPPEPVYRSTAPLEAPRFGIPSQERRPPDPPRYVQAPQPRPPAPVEAPPAPRPQAPSRPAAPALPAPGVARGLPAAAAPPPAPAAAPAPAPAPAPPAPRPAPPARPAPARYGPGLPAPEVPVSGSGNGHAAAPALELRPARSRSLGPLEIHRVRYEDLPAIVDLVNADLLPGQPTCGRHGLDMAMRGESTIDATWWRELSDVRVAVASRGGAVVGAASYAIAAADRSGWLLWLHAREERSVVEALIDHALAELNGTSHLYAFWIATALTLGVEALPVEQQPVTHELLTSRGLMGRDSWRYLVLPMERFALDDRADDVATVRPIPGPGGIAAWELVIGDREAPAACAEIALASEGCGVLRWIDVEPSQRGRGVGRRLLRQSLRFLALRGAQTVAAIVDHADPRERDPGPILRLLGSAGFHEVDRLWSYESPRRRR